jgi:hypothetical protein
MMTEVTEAGRGSQQTVSLSRSTIPGSRFSHGQYAKECSVTDFDSEEH